jgi:hypothetical protein
MRALLSRFEICSFALVSDFDTRILDTDKARLTMRKEIA